MLKRLDISGLRGATKKFELDFERGKQITIIYGENGTGKSTICDGIELIARGKIGSLEGKGLGRTDAYWRSTGRRIGDMSVTLTSTRGQWSAKVVGGKVTVAPAEGRPYAAVLRRGQILDLIAQQPRHRFDAIRPFLDIDAVEKSEAALKQLIDQETLNERTSLARIEEIARQSRIFGQRRGNQETMQWYGRELNCSRTLLVCEQSIPFWRI
ncbi:MAG: ATP-binding protein [Anaerolineae bacterium]